MIDGFDYEQEEKLKKTLSPEIKVTTEFNKSRISHTISNRNIIGAVESIQKTVMNLQEAQTRQALIDLGWTPPDKEVDHKLVSTASETLEELTELVKKECKTPPCPHVDCDFCNMKEYISLVEKHSGKTWEEINGD